MIVLGPSSSNPSDSKSIAIRALFPSFVCAAFADSTEDPGPIHPDEAVSVENAVDSRRREFALGRRCARAALEALGVAAESIPAGADRSTIWPAGVVGSITHCRGFVGAVVASRLQIASIGFDVETAAPLNEELVSMICTPREMAWVREQPPSSSSDWPKVFFSAKESIHKCISPLSGIMLDFTDVNVTISPSLESFTAELIAEPQPQLPDFARLSGRLRVSDGYVFTGAVIRS